LIRTTKTTTLGAGDRFDGRLVARHDGNESVDDNCPSDNYPSDNYPSDNYPSDNYPVTTTTRPERSRIDS
jgi:hypothetical protein